MYPQEENWGNRNGTSKSVWSLRTLLMAWALKKSCLFTYRIVSSQGQNIQKFRILIMHFSRSIRFFAIVSWVLRSWGEPRRYSNRKLNLSVNFHLLISRTVLSLSCGSYSKWCPGAHEPWVARDFGGKFDIIVLTSDFYVVMFGADEGFGKCWIRACKGEF